MRHHRPTMLLHALALAAGLALTAPALSQAPLVPQTIVTATSVDDAGRKVIRDAVAPHAQSLADAQTPGDKVANARKALLQPLSASAGATPSTGFRLAYAEELAKALRSTLASGSAMAKVNALVIAGELGTGDATALIATARKDADASVRFQAADATRAILTTFATAKSPLIGAEEVRKLIDETQKAAATEKDPLVIDAMFACFEAATGSPVLQEPAVRALADAANTLARNAGNATLDARLVESLQRGSLTLINLVNQGGQLAAASKVGAGDFAGSVLWHTSRALQAKALPGGDAGKTQRDAYARMARGAENLLLLAGKSLTPDFNVAPKNVDAKIRQGNTQGDAAFVADGNDLMATLAGKPFNVVTSRYK